MGKHTVSVLVENQAGVLSRVVGLFSRRGFNIDSLSVGTTADENISRITIEVIGDEQIVEQVGTEVMEIANVFRAKIVDISPSTLTIEMTGNESKLDAFIEMIRPFGIEEISRTGMTALERGSNILKVDK